jgi:uncharacterized protein RhaS with RHS repeats
MYDPKAGRFLSEDMIGLMDDVNPSRYVKNSPLNFTDPSGLDAEPSPGTPENGYNGIGEWEFKNKNDLIKFLSALLNADQKGFPVNWVKMAERGCIGLAYLRIGWGTGNPPFSPLSYLGAEFYVDPATALARLKELQGKNDGKQWVMVAVQVPVKGDPNRLLKNLGTGAVNLNQIPIDRRKGADYNWATWFPSGENSGYWEYMNTNWETINPKIFPKVIHSKTLPNLGKGYITLYMIVELRGWQ